MKKITNEEKEKKYELTGLTRQTLDLCRESLITKQKKKLTGYPELIRLTRQTRDPCHKKFDN